MNPLLCRWPVVIIVLSEILNYCGFRFLGILLQDMEQYSTAMDVVLNILDNYYEAFHLESSAVV